LFENQAKAAACILSASIEKKYAFLYQYKRTGIPFFEEKILVEPGNINRIHDEAWTIQYVDVRNL
jgi:hypothetical protein